MKCPECDTEVTADVAECPACGLIFERFTEVHGAIETPTPKDSKKSQISPVTMVFALVGLVLGFLLSRWVPADAPVVIPPSKPHSSIIPLSPIVPVGLATPSPTLETPGTESPVSAAAPPAPTPTPTVAAPAAAKPAAVSPPPATPTPGTAMPEPEFVSETPEAKPSAPAPTPASPAAP